MSLELTVLGSAGSHPGPGRACSGYLVQTDGANVVVDCGNGSTANLYDIMEIGEVDAVVISHKHVDHCVDLIGAYYALRFNDAAPRSVDVYAPDGVFDQLHRLVDGDPAFGDVCRFHPLQAGRPVEIGALRIDPFASIHTVPTVSLRMSVDGTVLAYSADSAGGPDLVACARDADLFLCEASWQGDRSAYPSGLHLVATEAGEVATAAGVDQLVLTHIWPTLDPQRSVEEARAAFTGDVTAAEDRRSWKL